MSSASDLPGAIERLQIDRIAIDRFGGWSDRSLELPDEQLIVIHGSNEAGKSTLAELVTWLLVGPSGTAANAQRFGRPDERIGGTMSLRLGGTAITATGSFRVPKSGAPTENDLVIDIGRAVTAGEWRERLGGIDPQVFAAIYRLWGEQLHGGEGIEDELSRVALGALAGRINVPSLIAQLDSEVTDRSSRRARGAESVLTIAARLDEIRTEVAAASANADEHLALEQRRIGLEASRTELSARITALHAEADVVRQALELTDELHELHETEAARARLDDVSEHWVAVAQDLTLVTAIAEATVATADALTTAETEARSAFDRAGMDEDAVTALSIGDAEMIQIGAGATALRAARAELDDIDGRLAEAERDEREATELLDRELIRRPGLTVEDVATIRLDSAERSSVVTSIATWSAREKAVTDSSTDVAQAADRVSAVEAELVTARSSWEAFGTGQAAEAWFASRHSQRSDPTNRWWWVSPLAAIVVAVVAFIVGQILVSAIAGLAAAITVVVALSGRRGGVPSEETVTEMSEVATRILGLVRQRDDAVAAAQRSADEHRRHAEALDAARRATVQAAAAFAIPIDADEPEVASTQLVALEEIVMAFRRVRECRSAVDELQQQRADVLGHLEAADQQLRSAMGSAGFPEAMASEMIDGALPAYRAAQVAGRALTEARHAHRSADDRYRELVAPLPAEIAQWSPTRLVERVTEVHNIESTRRTLDETIASLHARLSARRAADENLSELLERGLTEAELQARSATIEASIDELKNEAESISEQIGTLSNQLDSLGRVDRLAALAVERGSLLERSEELATEALVAAVAKRILHSVADEYERQHQPALIEATERMVRSVAPHWDAVVVRAGDDDRPEVVVAQRGLAALRASQLSTGARGLLYLALRIAMAEHDGERRAVSVPLICDDPLVHLDDERADSAFQLLRKAAESGRQVVVFTCHERTVRAGEQAGAAIVEI